MQNAMSAVPDCSDQQPPGTSKSSRKQGGRIVGILKTADAKRRNHRRRLRHRLASGAEGTNNSMPLADKNYTAPEPPGDCDAYLYGLSEKATENRESLRPFRRNFITLFLRVRKPNFETLLWQYIASGVIPKDNIYSSKYLPHWTIGIRIRVRNCYPLGNVIEAMRYRLGIMHPGLRFCIDGFFGMINYTDIFRNQDACPWMAVSKNSTVQSLKLRDGDNLFISIATVGQIENVANYQKKKLLGMPSTTGEAADSGPLYVRVSDSNWGRSSRRSTTRQLPFPALST